MQGPGPLLEEEGSPQGAATSQTIRMGKLPDVQGSKSDPDPIPSKARHLRISQEFIDGSIVLHPPRARNHGVENFETARRFVNQI